MMAERSVGSLPPDSSTRNTVEPEASCSAVVVSVPSCPRTAAAAGEMRARTGLFPPVLIARRPLDIAA